MQSIECVCVCIEHTFARATINGRYTDCRLLICLMYGKRFRVRPRFQFPRGRSDRRRRRRRRRPLRSRAAPIRFTNFRETKRIPRHGESGRRESNSTSYCTVVSGREFYEHLFHRVICDPFEFLVCSISEMSRRAIFRAKVHSFNRSVSLRRIRAIYIGFLAATRPAESTPRDLICRAR